MKHSRIWLALLAALCLSIESVIVLTSCDHIQSVGGEVGYTPATGEITAGITITFKSPPAPDVALALTNAGASGGGTNWVILAVTNQVQRLAINKALMAGATLTAPPARKR